MNIIDWIKGDTLGLNIPAHSDALRAGGEAFLTQAFHASGALSETNRITRITECKEVSGGSTGSKLLLAVEYETPSPSLHNELFVKFSRAFDDPVRDETRVQMELEVLFALLSRVPEFPIHVPVCYFTDFHHASGTGILITQRIPFGVDGVEPLYPKSLDYQMPDQLGHYQALVRALAKLAGTHKADALPDSVETYFPFDPAKLSVSARAPRSPEQIQIRVQRYAEFTKAYPNLVPAHLRTEAFIERLLEEGPRFQSMQPVVGQILQSQPDMIALCHWNAHVDNAWFWREASGELACGLFDWGNVSQMNVAMALWGCLSAAELFIWNDHLDELLQLFVEEFRRCGGPELDVAILMRHLTLYVGMMGLEWMLDAPVMITKHAPGLSSITERLDPMIQNSERARSQLLIMTVFLNLWEKQDMSQVLDDMEHRFDS